ncbi:Rrf2 family transcriptional regulator [Paenibacillus rigui]|uniref:Transcriptional regulator n=1 Tax=Paenibacillus rigui TaxID=554312 RepID=A0A229URI4_9BACL|nr:Rrf2 family transcriptional regulator [Paenibacillus rigui]OXM86207.1 transcriptional regulator [Paenibacillus rigui]
MKQISSRFSVAVHILSIIALFPNESTGEFIAGSVNTNPVIIRKIIRLLKKAGLIAVRPGVGGASLLKDTGEITLLDIYRAVEVADQGELFHFHEEPNHACLVGNNIENALRDELRAAQLAMEQRLAQVTLQQLIAKFV